MQSKRLPLIALLLAITWLSGCWAQDDFRICFKETERSSQCQRPANTCSGWSSSPQWSEAFRDDTDDRGGGCKYHWRIEKVGTPSSNREYRLCFQETEGSSQCQLARSSCTGWSSNPSWTRPFRDDTDDRGGGCKYQWKIESRPTEYSGFEVCRVCFKETESSSQCQGCLESCSGWTASENPEWTAPFRDDTDDRGGGCEYQWFLDCTTRLHAAACSPRRPCYFFFLFLIILVD